MDATAVTLFSLINGDGVHATFEELYSEHKFISRLYLYSFISLFIYAVLNIFIVIIEDAFSSCKEVGCGRLSIRNRFSYLRSPALKAEGST